MAKSNFEPPSSDRSSPPIAFANAVKAVARVGGTTVYEQLSQLVVEFSGGACAWVARSDPGDPEQLSVVAGDSEIKHYRLADSPCADVIANGCAISTQLSSAGHPLLATREPGLYYFGVPIIGDNGDTLGVVAALAITELESLPGLNEFFEVVAARCFSAIKASEAERDADDEVYRLMFDASLDGLGLMDSRGIVVDVNPALGQLDGYDRDEVIGQYPPRFRDPAEHEGYLDMIRRSLAGEKIHNQLFLPHKNGSMKPVEARNVRIVYRGEPHVLAIIRDLSERKQHEGQLRRSEDLYRAMFDASLDGLSVLDSGGRVVDVNPALTQVDGFTRDELIGQLPPAFRAAEMQKFHRKYVDTVLAKGQLRGEVELVRKNGQRYTAEMRSVRIEFRDQPHVLAVVRDISDRHEREVRLAASEDRYRTVFEATIDGLALIRKDGLIVDVNQAMVDLDGFSREELVGHMPPTYIGDEAKIAQHREYVRRVLNHESVKREFYFERKNGSRYFAEVRSVRMNHNGEPHVLLIIRDISEQKRQHAALAQSEDRLRATVTTALDSIVVMNEAGQIIDFNPAAELCFGYRRDEVLGQPLDEVIIPEQFRQQHKIGLEEYLRSGHGPFIGKRIEVDAIRKDGTILQTELAISVANGAQGKIFVGYLRDITAQKRAAEQSSVLEAQLRQAQKMEAIGHLTGGIAHDFNNILTSVLGYVVLARDYVAPQNDSKLERYLERAERAGGRARDLIAQMLTFSRGQLGERKDVDTAALAVEALTLMESSLPASVEMTTDFATELPRVNIDPVHFEQILVNLCINARDAMDGNGKIRVSIQRIVADQWICSGCREVFHGSYLELAVADNGPGIDASVAERIFEPFFTTKDVGKGSGMGLSTVHGIVHDHHGHAVVDSERGRGTTMRVLLPYATANANVDDSNEGGAKQADRNQLSGQVMLVDDNLEVSEFLDDLLVSWGMGVKVFNDPVLARQHFVDEGRRYDLVITDQTMPQLSGMALAQAILDKSPDTPVFLYTGYSESISEEQALAAGIRAFLSKPLDTAQLNALIREIVS